MVLSGLQVSSIFVGQEKKVVPSLARGTGGGLCTMNQDTSVIVQDFSE